MLRSLTKFIVNQCTKFDILQPCKKETISMPTICKSPRKLNCSNVRIKLAKPKDTKNIVHLLRNSYADCEPLVGALNINKNKSNQVMEELWLRSIEQGLTLIAVNENDFRNPQVVGAMINVKNCSWDADQLDHLAGCLKCDKMKKLLNLFALFDREPKLHESLQQNRIFDMSLSVTENNNAEVKHMLIEHSLNFARDLGYMWARLNSSNEETSQIAENCGMNKVWQFPFVRILNQFREPVLSMNYSSTHAKVYTYKLGESNLRSLSNW